MPIYARNMRRMLKYSNNHMCIKILLHLFH